MDNITESQYEEACDIILKYNLQNNVKTVEVTVTYNCKLTNTIQVPKDWTVDQIKEEISDGFYYDDEEEEAEILENIVYEGISELVINGKKISL